MFIIKTLFTGIKTSGYAIVITANIGAILSVWFLNSQK